MTTRVKSFRNAEEMFEYMREQHEAARTAETYAFQEAIEAGDNYAQWSESAQVMIFGEVLKDDEEEAREAPWQRLVKAYSVICPDGEMGYTHVGHMVPIPAELFERARECRWSAEVWTNVAVQCSQLMAAEMAARGEN